MMSPLELAKQALPLPQLMERLGLGQHAKKSARCPFHEDNSNSFSVFQSSDGEWRWNCFAGCTPQGKPADGPDLIAKLESLSSADACRRYISLAGVDSHCAPSFRATTAPRRQAMPVKDPERVPVMPQPVSDEWHDGVRYLQERPVIAGRLASQRGWPVEFMQELVLWGAVSMPRYDSERAIAFQVVCPEGGRGAMCTRPVGYHIRIDDGSWRYRPTGIPGLPYILGDFEMASLLVITEGAWDSLSFALAAGWIGGGCAWPNGVGIVGIRGARGHAAFLAHYRRYWPESADCLLLPDNDEPGRKWHDGAGDCFAVQLSKLCRKVAVVDCHPHKDFNDMYRAERPAPEAIRDLLAAHGMTVESEVIA